MSPETADPKGPPELAVIAQGGYDYLRDLKEALRRGGVRAEIVPGPPEAQNPAAAPLLLLAVASTDIAEATRCVREHWGEGLDDEVRQAAEATVDLDAAEWTCPACGTSFDGGAERCPGCGLKLG